MMKKFLILALCVALVFTSTACGALDSLKSLLGSKTDSESDSAENVATVNSVNITTKRYEDTLNESLASQGLDLDTLTEQYGAEETANYKNYILEELIVQELMVQKAAELGLDTLSDEELTQVEADVQSYKDEVRSYIESTISNDDGEYTDEELQEEIDKQYDAYMEEKGYTEDYILNEFKRNAVLQKVYNSVIADYSVTEADILDYYNAQLAVQQGLDEDDPDSAMTKYVNSEYDIDLYVPTLAETQNLRYVKHILIGIPEDTVYEIEDQTNQGNTTEAKQLKDEALAEIQAEADEALAKAQAGEDFDELMTEYSDDTGMAYYPNGYMLYTDVSNFVQAFADAGLSLKNVGDITGLVESEYGYHIIKLVSIAKAGPIPYEEIHDALTPIATSAKTDEYWIKVTDQWMADAEITKTTFTS